MKTALIQNRRIKSAIDYRDDVSIDILGNRYIHDLGHSPKHPLALNSGQGVWGNNVDQSISTTVNGYVQTICYLKNGSLVFDETAQTLANWEITIAQLNGVNGNYILYDGIFTQSQKDYLYQNPEKFLYKDGVLKSDILTQSEISNVVAWFPMCETDGYVRDMVGYSEVEKFPIDNTFTDWVSSDGSTATIDGEYLAMMSSSSSNGLYETPTTIAGYIDKYYTLKLDTKDYIGGTLGFMRLDGIYDANNVILFGENNHAITFKAYRDFSKIRFISGNADSGYSISNAELVELTGTYPIKNYTTDCRNLAKELPYGLQTNLIDTDVLGVPTGKGDYLSLKGTEIPALPIDLTDDVLWGNGTGFVIEFVIERDIIDRYDYLLGAFEASSPDNNARGMYLYINRMAEDLGSIKIRLYNNQPDYSSTYASGYIDDNPHHIIFEVTPTDMTMIVDGVAGTSVSHSFVPSGLNFKDSTKLAPKGNLHSFKMWFGDNYAKYDRAKSVEAGTKLIQGLI